MEEHVLITAVFFVGIFLGLTALLKTFSEKISFPYTVMLLIVGFWARAVTEFFHIETHLHLSTDIVYFILLPLLLFESAMHINGHQFRLQFKTITFISTFGLLFSIFSVGVGLSLLLGFPFLIALLFGSLISATDPIAVLALFKTLGAPKRLGLIAEGESMFNDATAVIMFRVVSGFILTSGAVQTFTIAYSFFHFIHVFVGSLLVGAVLGYITSQFIAKIDNDRLVETTLTIALALGSFAITEHFLGLSGVIGTVASGVTLGNIGRTKVSGGVINFMHELWEYIGFLAVSLVFFFASFHTDLSTLFTSPMSTISVIAVVLIARALSVYGSFFVTNSLHFFEDEPNIPLRWQHILNWGGLRGVIPLVLVYSLPDTFLYKEVFLTFTLMTFLFTLFVNATTIGWLLKKLRLHLPKREEEIIQQEVNIFAIEEAKKRLGQLSSDDADLSVIKEVAKKLSREEFELKKSLMSMATPRELEKSLKLQAISIERKSIQRLFYQGHIKESVFFDFDNDLDLQEDAQEYPEVSSGRSYARGGKRRSQENFRERMARWRQRLAQFPFLKSIILQTKEDLIMDRLSLLQARIVASSEVIEYFEHVGQLLEHHVLAQKVIDQVTADHEQFRLKNSIQLQSLEREYQRVYKKFETQLVESYAWDSVDTHA